MKQLEELKEIQKVLRLLSELCKAVEEGPPQPTKQRLWRTEPYKQLKERLEEQEWAVNRGGRPTELQSIWLSHVLTEAIGHLTEESRITRSQWAIDEGLDSISEEIASREKTK